MGSHGLTPDEFYHACKPEHIPFDNTAEAENHLEILGQSRALDAIHFVVGIAKEGYNLYLAGSTGLGKQTALRRAIAERAAAMPIPPDWCYVNNFEQVQKPQALRLPSGRGRQLREGMKIRDLQ